MAIGLDPHNYSPHNFRRGGATFAFACKDPAELLKFQGGVVHVFSLFRDVRQSETTISCCLDGT